MSIPESKIKIKMGSIEIEYEGSSDFLKQEIFDLVEAVSKLHQVSHDDGLNSLIKGPEYIENLAGVGEKIEGSCNEIAKKLSAKNGTELIFAASSKLYFVDCKERFTYEEIRSEMNSASNYVNEAMKKNFAQNLKSVVKQDRLKDLGGKTYSLAAAKIDETRARIV
ncbi:hypothetical protein [Thalassospira alkalitolerans]|uniref:hypothetical protein n=1 Tax=Thalassospira alkalitolerans TaxID=1293890 RepID=UPI0030EB23FD|tara:strand:+ start:29866 stop:30363 length:498 start_codon:yes stop_codon:yes gene_type:complete